MSTIRNRRDPTAVPSKSGTATEPGSDPAARVHAPAPARPSMIAPRRIIAELIKRLRAAGVATDTLESETVGLQAGISTAALDRAVAAARTANDAVIDFIYDEFGPDVPHEILQSNIDYYIEKRFRIEDVVSTLRF